MRRTQIYLEDEQEKRLRAEARAAGVTKSALIRRAIDALLGRRPGPGEIEVLLDETFGAVPGFKVPPREEWDRGHG